MGAIRTLGSVSNGFRFNTFRILIVSLVVATVIVTLGAYNVHPQTRTSWTHTTAKLHQVYTNVKTGVVATVGSHRNSTSTPNPICQPGYGNGLCPSKTNIDLVPKFSMVDGIEVSPPAPPADTDEYIAICMLVKEVPQELQEFITHHYYHHGIRRFYVYDDGSNPPLASYPLQSTYNVPPSVLNFSYIEPDSVNLTERKRLQSNIMERCVKEHGHKHHWFGLLDPDEFLEMRHPLHPTLLGWLKHWEDKYSMWVEFPKNPEGIRGEWLRVGGLAISWIPHNSANLIEIPTSGGFRKNYNECVAGGPAAKEVRPDYWLLTHTKSFVRPEALDYLQNIHVPVLKEGWTRFSERGTHGFISNADPTTVEYWGLHHYATGSRKYFEAKAAKGRSQGPGMWPVDEEYWDRNHKNVTTYTCDEMIKYDP